MKAYVVLPVLHLASAFLPNYLDPGNRFQAIRTQYDPRQRLMGQLQRSEVSVEDSLDADTLVTLHGGAITNMNGDDRYPVNFEKPIRVFLDVTSVAPRR
ncbi:hypothetical protein ANCCAN_26591 [Ancylostoma caninum]|uniref:Uncharacterized protein n=1 Tax=Ancylostoma caninum TaxID=29170 RepID=A0A368F6A7_ANCCA|nr:hypothetical protein ANCCAN_26591 [Ancylostoma caninum]